jgi:hypothetical protein
MWVTYTQVHKGNDLDFLPMVEIKLGHGIMDFKL